MHALPQRLRGVRRRLVRLPQAALARCLPSKWLGHLWAIACEPLAISVYSWLMPWLVRERLQRSRRDLLAASSRPAAS